MVRAKLYIEPRERLTPIGSIITLVGSLVDAVTGRGIPFAPVTVMANNIPIATVKTDHYGRFELPVKLPAVGKYSIQGKFLGGEY